jgi:hypothetical protein
MSDHLKPQTLCHQPHEAVQGPMLRAVICDDVRIENKVQRQTRFEAECAQTSNIWRA